MTSLRTKLGLAVESLAAAITAIKVPGMQSPALGTALAKATADWSSATREERMIAHFFLFSFFKLLENAWYQQKAGILDQAQWVGWETMLLRASMHHKRLMMSGDQSFRRGDTSEHS